MYDWLFDCDWIGSRAGASIDASLFVFFRSLMYGFENLRELGMILRSTGLLTHDVVGFAKAGGVSIWTPITTIALGVAELARVAIRSPRLHLRLNLFFFDEEVGVDL